MHGNLKLTDWVVTSAYHSSLHKLLCRTWNSLNNYLASWKGDSTKINKMCFSKAISFAFPFLLPYFISPFVPSEVNSKIKECVLHDTALGFQVSVEPKSERQREFSLTSALARHGESTQTQSPRWAEEVVWHCRWPKVAGWTWIHQLSNMWSALPLQAVHLAVHTKTVQRMLLFW